MRRELYIWDFGLFSALEYLRQEICAASRVSDASRWALADHLVHIELARLTSSPNPLCKPHAVGYLA